MKNAAASVTLFLSLVVLGLLPGCATAPPGFKHVVIATNNGAKFNMKEPLGAGNTIQWQGAVDAKGFASGKGTQIFVDATGEKISEFDSSVVNGVDAAGPYELRKYSDGVLISKDSGQLDGTGQYHGRVDKVNFDATQDDDSVRAYTHFEHGVRSGKSHVFYKDGSQLIEEYSNGERDSRVTISKNGEERRDYFLERRRQLHRESQEFHARAAQEESDRRASRNQTMLSGLASGLASLAADASSSSSSSGSSYSSPSSSSDRGALTLSQTKTESRYDDLPRPTGIKRYVTIESQSTTTTVGSTEAGAIQKYRYFCNTNVEALRRGHRYGWKLKVDTSKTPVWTPPSVTFRDSTNGPNSKVRMYYATGGRLTSYFYYEE